MEAIDPTRQYSFAEIRKIVPSAKGGCRLSLETLHRWRVEGRFVALSREVKGRKYWFAWGSEVQKLLGGPPPAPQEAPMQESERQRQVAAATEQLRRRVKEH